MSASSPETGQSVQSFYDDFVDYQQQVRINLRHYRIFQGLVNAGLKKHHTLLEIGCGTGSLTVLLHRYMRKGKLVATDISPRSIAVAEQQVKGSRRISFICTDMVGFTHEDRFDFIVLPDVLEHIPREQHREPFAMCNNLLKEQGKLVIHIPHGTLNAYYEAQLPEKLQIIDHQLDAPEVINQAYAANFRLETYRHYRLFHQVPDYVFSCFTKATKPEFVLQNKWAVRRKKLSLRLQAFLRSL